jgi:carboxylate-amine ligase
MGDPGASTNAIVFNSSPAPTVGVEVEMFLVDAGTGELVQAADEILETLAAGNPEGHPKAKHELFRSTIEAITGICTTVGEAGEDLRGTMAEVAAVAGELDVELMACGTHPFSRWQDQVVSPGPRYEKFLGRLGWPVRRLAINGIHVHVGVSSGEAAVAITQALREQLPLLVALSASSPFWDGADTDLASVRTKIFESLPTSGLPPHLGCWEDFETFMHGLLRAGVIGSIREVWWDIRPHPDFGTVELRMCDATPTLGETLAIAAIAQCLVASLERRLANGEELHIERDWVVISQARGVGTLYRLERSPSGIR